MCIHLKTKKIKYTLWSFDNMPFRKSFSLTINRIRNDFHFYLGYNIELDCSNTCHSNSRGPDTVHWWWWWLLTVGGLSECNGSMFPAVSSSIRLFLPCQGTKSDLEPPKSASKSQNKQLCSFLYRRCRHWALPGTMWLQCSTKIYSHMHSEYTHSYVQFSVTFYWNNVVKGIDIRLEPR